MAAIDDLIQQIEDPELRRRIKQEADKLTKSKKFGLVFEDHIPECTPLYDMPIKRGSLVARKSGNISDLYEVDFIDNDIAVCYKKSNSKKEEISLDELVCVARFGDPIYPYLKPIDQVYNAPDSDLWHTLIEADNYHALQLLEYLYAGKVDCIYIDPPYNTGAKNWKYNNDYVDDNDSFRHSKWLSMMSKRLFLAKKLLNKDTGIIAIAIDDYEIAPLKLLADDIFKNGYLGTVVVKNNPQGRSMPTGFQISHEYVLLYGGSDAVIGDLPRNKKQISRYNFIDDNGPYEWRNFRAQYSTISPRLIYPIYIKKDGSGLRVPKMRWDDENKVYKTLEDPNSNEFISLPVDSDGKQKTWKWSLQTFLDNLDSEISVRKDKNKQYSVYYKGRMKSSGMKPFTLWDDPKYSSSTFGTNLISSLIGKNKFNYPKSLYSVEDCISICCRGKKDALILDFFAGSGTTLHAVLLMNKKDDGNRRCICVTNNELSSKEEESLIKNNVQPGDSRWEKLGIARFVTWPRILNCINGQDCNGKSLKGNYYDTDIAMSTGFNSNVAYFKLNFLDKNSIALGRQLKDLIPVLWMKSNCKGVCPDNVDVSNDMLLFPDNKFAVLVNENRFNDFHDKIIENDIYDYLYFITDSASGYREMISDFRKKNTFQLYRDYLDNFRINTVR